MGRPPKDPDIDLESMSLPALQMLREEINNRIEDVEPEERARFIEEGRVAARERGLDPDTIFREQKKRRKRRGERGKKKTSRETPKAKDFPPELVEAARALGEVGEIPRVRGKFAWPDRKGPRALRMLRDEPRGKRSTWRRLLHELGWEDAPKK